MFEYPLQVAEKLIAALGEDSSKLPLLERFVEVLFFASLLREEGNPITFNVVYPGIFNEAQPTPERVNGYAPWHAIDLDPAIGFDATSAAKFASLAAGEGEHLIVHCVSNGLVISGVGINQELPWFSFEHRLLTARIVGAGLLRFFHGGNEIFSYTSGTVALPHKWPFASPQIAMGDVVAAMSEMIKIAPAKDVASAALNKISGELIGRGHGGIVAICSKNDTELQRTVEARTLKAPLEFGRLFTASWEASAVAASKSPPTPEQRFEEERASAESERALSLIGRMTTIDGAVLITSELSVVGFGTKLPAAGATPPVMRVSANGTLEVFDMTKRGTRHRGAACFVANGALRIALIASADGDAAAMFKNEDGQVLYWPVRDRYGAFGL
jgi:sensor domain DACNV-containing protein